MTTENDFQAFFDKYFDRDQAAPRAAKRRPQLDLIIRILVGALILAIGVFAVLTVYYVWPKTPPELPQTFQALPYAILDCAAIDVDLDSMPDVLACPGGQAFLLSPFGGGS